jgi:EmrB/QacA subfamily drug resistance transporter
MISAVKQPCDEAVIQAGRDRSPCSEQVGRWVLAATILGSGITFIDGTVVNVALPVLQEKLKASATEAQWIIESYSLFLSALILVGGSFGDRFGRRRMFELGVIAFGLASMWCGIAPNVRQLIVARAVQGVGAAFLVPGSLALLSSTFSKEQRGKAIGTWSALTSVTAGAGPVVGGWIIQNASWRWIFFLNIPLCIAVLLISRWRVPESRDKKIRGSIDWMGGFLSIIGLAGIVYAAIESNDLQFTHPVVLISGFIGIAAIAVFLYVESRAETPLVPLHLFRSKTFAGANLFTFFLYAALGGFLFFLPFNLIKVHGYPPTVAGAAMLPFVLTMFFFSRWSGGLVDRYGARRPLIFGPILVGAGYASMALLPMTGNYWTSFFPGILLMSFGMTLSVAPLTTTVMGSVEGRWVGTASGINNAVSRMAGLLAIALLGILVLRSFNNSLEERLNILPVSPQVKDEISQERKNFTAIEIPSGLSSQIKAQLNQALKDSLSDAFDVAAIVTAILAFASALTAWLMIDRL